MSLTNKLFSLLGFAEPIALERFNGKNPLPEHVLFLSTSDHLNVDIHQTLAKLPINTIERDEKPSEKPIEAIVIDATNYSDERNYQNLYSTVQESLNYLIYNAKILIIASAISSKKSAEQNAFSQSLVGFSKSLAKEVGRKGSTVNVILIDNEEITASSDISAVLEHPLSFFLSTKSAFVSGQVLTLNCQKQSIQKIPTSSKKHKVALVTGAAQGIGASITNKLNDEGYYVIGVDIEPMKAQLISTMNNLHGESFILDVSANNAGEQLAMLASKHAGFDLIVHNAGITRDKTIAKMPEHFWQQTIDINLLSVIRINKVLLKEKCINEGGSIVCLSSMNGIAGQGGQTNYACSKAGIIGYVKSISTELSTNNITINAVAPGFIETQMTNKVPFFIREMGRRMSALGQGGLPVDVAETVAFLGNKSNFAITGQTLRVCGLNIIGA